MKAEPKEGYIAFVELRDAGRMQGTTWEQWRQMSTEQREKWLTAGHPERREIFEGKRGQNGASDLEADVNG